MRLTSRNDHWTTLLASTLLVLWMVPAAKAQAPTSFQAATDRIIYNVGEQVKLRMVSPSPESDHPGYLFSVSYAGDTKPVADGLVLGDAGFPPLLWAVPADARTGRYEIGLRVQDPASRKVIQDIPRIASFVVTRQVVQILSVTVDRTYYTSGDAIGCTVGIENRSDRLLEGLRLEFSERYWPWIVQQRDRVGTDIEKLQNEITLKPHESTGIINPRCAVARKVDQPATEQFSAVVWDRDRKNVYAIAITPLVFVNPPGVTAPQPYPGQYIYPSLEKLNISTYRQFHPESYGADAIKFDTRHTMYPSGAHQSHRHRVAPGLRTRASDRP